MTPKFSFEPLDQPKMFILAPLAFSILGVLLVNIKELMARVNRIFLLIVSIFVLQLFLVLIFSGAPFVQQFFGAQGRNTGLLTYFSFSVIAIAASIISSLKSHIRIYFCLLIIGCISAVYALIQTMGLDPINWANPYNPIIGFLGNPNFESSFLGMCAVATLSLLLRRNLVIWKRLLILTYIVFIFILILRSHALQGILVFAIGSVVLIFLYLAGVPKLARKPFLLSYLALVGIFGSILVSGMLKIGPLADYLYKNSVRQRGFYWHAAFEMMKSHPFFGVGLDSYGDWYYEFRSANAAFYSPDTMSNSAHNVFLELGANGGVFLFLSYLGLSLITCWTSFDYLKKNPEFNWVYAGFLATWIGYEAQALVSINQPGLAIWGWILMGLLIGYPRINLLGDSIDSQSIKKEPKKISRNKQASTSRNIKLQALVGFIIGLLIVLPYFKADANFRVALESRNGNQVIVAALANPIVTGRTMQAATSLANSQLKAQAYDLAHKVTSINSRAIDGWLLKYNLTKIDSIQHKEARIMLDKLNPHVPIK